MASATLDRLERVFDTGRMMSTPDQLLESALHTEAVRLALGRRSPPVSSSSPDPDRDQLQH